MQIPPTLGDLEQALSVAGSTHHDYEQDYLKGARDEQWAGYYSAYVLGRLGDFAAPSVMARWLETAPAEDNWAAAAARHVLSLIER